jgi:hypothetical protein
VRDGRDEKDQRDRSEWKPVAGRFGISGFESLRAKKKESAGRL